MRCRRVVPCRSTRPPRAPDVLRHHPPEPKKPRRAAERRDRGSERRQSAQAVTDSELQDAFDLAGQRKKPHQRESQRFDRRIYATDPSTVRGGLPGMSRRPR